MPENKGNERRVKKVSLQLIKKKNGEILEKTLQFIRRTDLGLMS